MTEDKVEKEAENIASGFVGTLGLLDLIFGGLLLYLLFLRTPTVAAHFPSTGSHLIDIALLACAAALLGKLITLAAAICFAAFSAVYGARTGLRSRLATSLGLTPSSSKVLDGHVVDRALTAIAVRSPEQFRRVMTIRTNAVFILGGGLLAFAYAFHLHTFSLGISKPLLFVLAAVAVGLGHMHYAEYLRDIEDTINELLAREARLDAKSQTSENPSPIGGGQ